MSRRSPGSLPKNLDGNQARDAGAPCSYQLAINRWHRLSSLCWRRLNHHGRFGPPPITKFLVGAVREPPLRVDFHGKACGYKSGSLNATRYQSLASAFRRGRAGQKKTAGSRHTVRVIIRVSPRALHMRLAKGCSAVRLARAVPRKFFAARLPGGNCQAARPGSRFGRSSRPLPGPPGYYLSSLKSGRTVCPAAA